MKEEKIHFHLSFILSPSIQVVRTMATSVKAHYALPGIISCDCRQSQVIHSLRPKKKKFDCHDQILYIVKIV